MGTFVVINAQGDISLIILIILKFGKNIIY